jgi:branched-chain amino acid transport system substrate-binding protein
VRRSVDLAKSGALPIDRRSLLKLFAAAGMAGAVTPALAACGSSATSQQRSGTLSIGLVYPQSGPNQDLGFEILNGFTLWLNANGNRIGGMQVKVTNIDEGQTAATGKGNIQTSLKSNSFHALVGVANSDTMAALPAVMTGAQTPLIGTLGSPQTLLTSDYIWRTSFVAGEAGQAIGMYLAALPTADHMGNSSSELGRPNLVGIYSDGSHDSDAEAQSLAGQLAHIIDTYTIDGTNLVNDIHQNNPDLVFAAVSTANALSFLKSYSGNVNKPLCGPGSLTELFATQAQARNVFSAMVYAPDLDNAANQQFASAYFASQPGKVPSTYAMAAYDAGTVLDAAIRLIPGDVTPATINTALAKVGVFDSPRGQWQFNQSRTPLQQWYLRQVRKDGQIEENTVLANLVELT